MHPMDRLCRLAVLVLLTAAVPATAQSLQIDVGTHELLPNTPGQRVAITFSGDTAVTGLNLRAQLGDGLGDEPEPVFDGVDLTGGFWDSFGTLTSGGVVDAADQFVQASVIFEGAGDSAVPGTGALLVELLIDTTGLSAGTFDLLLSGTEIGADSVFIAPGGEDLVPTIVNGTVQVIVPEPTGLALVIAPSLGLLFTRRARR